MLILLLLLESFSCPNASAFVPAEEVKREGFHFQVQFGPGGGAGGLGLFHNMEIGGTFSNGWTLAYDHVFIQLKGLGRSSAGPDLFGGHIVMLKVPIGSPLWILKGAVGPGGIHIQNNGIQLKGGVAFHAGIDRHWAVTPTSGMTLSLSWLSVILVDPLADHFGLALGLGYTWF